MDKEMHKNKLFEIIKEARDLPESKLIEIPGIDFKIAKNKGKEFRDNYFIYTTNMSDKEKLEFYNEMNFFIANLKIKGYIEEFNQLLTTFKSINKNYERIKNNKKLNKSDRTDDFEEMEKNLQKLKGQILDLKNNINNIQLKYIKNEMKKLENKAILEKNSELKVMSKNNKGSILKSDLDEYIALIQLTEILKVAKKSEKLDSLLIYKDMIITKTLKYNFDKAYSKIKIFKELENITEEIEQIKKVEEPINKNEIIILELRSYLRKLEQKLNEYKGVTNIPIKSASDGTLVLEHDKNEYDRILDIIKILAKAEKNAINIWNIGYVNVCDSYEFKELVNSTKYFSTKVPKIEENEKEIEIISKEIAKLIYKAEGKPKEMLAKNLVLKNDFEHYKLLENKRKYLESARASENLVDIDGVKIEEKYANKYQEIVNELKKYSFSDDNNLNEFKENKTNIIKENIEKTTIKMEEKINTLKHKVINIRKSNIKEKMKNKVRDIVPSEELLEIKENIINKIDSGKRKVISVKKLSSESIDKIKESWHTIKGIGLVKRAMLVTKIKNILTDGIDKVVDGLENVKEHIEVKEENNTNEVEERVQKRIENIDLKEYNVEGNVIEQKEQLFISIPDKEEIIETLLNGEELEQILDNDEKGLIK